MRDPTWWCMDTTWHALVPDPCPVGPVSIKRRVHICSNGAPCFGQGQSAKRLTGWLPLAAACMAEGPSLSLFQASMHHHTNLALPRPCTARLAGVLAVPRSNSAQSSRARACTCFPMSFFLAALQCVETPLRPCSVFHRALAWPRPAPLAPSPVLCPSRGTRRGVTPRDPRGGGCLVGCRPS